MLREQVSYGQANQKAVIAVTFWMHGPPREIFKITHFEIESEVIIMNIM